jgi:hypothetical protein
MTVDSEDIGIGPTKELCLRVSAATLVRVTFPHPDSGDNMLALERKATFKPDEKQKTISVTAQPFGGGIRISQPAALLAQIGDFHFDSLRSKDEQDFRILIRPAGWDAVKQYCLSALRAGRSTFLETDPLRELAEEFDDALQVTLSPTQYRLKPLEYLVENKPEHTHNLRAVNLPTVRIFTIFEARLEDPALTQRLLANSSVVSDHNLIELAREDLLRGNKGRANGILALPVDLLTKIYLDLAPDQRSYPIMAEGRQLEGNVAAILPEVFVPKYERFSL